MDGTFTYTLKVTPAQAATIATEHPEWAIERAYTYDADKARTQREHAKAKREADKQELEALRKMAADLAQKSA